MSRSLLFAMLATGPLLALAGPTAYGQNMPAGPGAFDWDEPPDWVGFPLDSIGPPPVLPGITEHCTIWHEILPTHGRQRHQSSPYHDNSDGVLSECDLFWIEGDIFWHVEWVGILFKLRCNAFPDQVIWTRPPEVGPRAEWHRIASSDPTCEIWHEVYPVYCNDLHIEGWTDNGNGLLDDCDDLLIGGELWHIEDVRWGCELDSQEVVPSTGRVGTLALVVVLALASTILIIRARKRAVQPAN